MPAIQTRAPAIRKPAVRAAASRALAACTVAAAALVAALPAAHAAEARFESFSYQGQPQEQVSAAPGEYRNPIVSGYYPDPAVMRVGEDYYLVNSSFSNFPGLPIFKSRDLVNWVQIGNAIDRPGQIDLTGRTLSQGIYAPDLSYHDGLFYLITTCVQCGGNFYMTARDPAGPWSDPVWLPFEGIDPSITWEGDRAWVVNNRAPDEPPRYEGHRAIWIQELDWRTGKMVGESTQLINGGVDISKKPVWIEGPHVFRREGYYYLTAAEGGTSENHSQVVFRSRELLGPYVPYAGNPILTQRDLPADRPNPITSAGHAMLVQTQKGDWWATFLATRPYADDQYNIGRETFLLPVTWSGGWPHILPHGAAIPWTHRKPDLPQAPAPSLPTSGAFSYVDSFEGNELAMQWIAIRTPHKPFYTVRDGALVLGSGAPLGDGKGTPAFVARRQQHHIAAMSTVMRFTPGDDGERAGLAAVQLDNSYVFFGITRIAGNPVLALYARDKSPDEQLVASRPIAPSGPITLTIRENGPTMGFDYTVDGKTQTLLDGFDAGILSTKRAGGFTGTIVGPYHYDPAAPVSD